METQSKFIDSIYNFKGLWDVNSKCGLKIVNKAKQTIVIVTNLWENNPGTSVTTFSAQLATIICNEFKIPLDKLMYIEHTPEKKTKLSFNEETFFIVNFTLESYKFSSPKWQQISLDKATELVS